VYILLFQPNVIFALITQMERKRAVNVLEKAGQNKQFPLYVFHVVEVDRDNVHSKRKIILIHTIIINERN
jgi:hypothetical protein